jgi:hypothetical protein
MQQITVAIQLVNAIFEAQIVPIQEHLQGTDMPLSQFTRKLVESRLSKYCSRRIQSQALNQVRLTFKIRGNSVTLFEERPAFRYPSNWVTMSIAQFRFDDQTKKWTLYCRDRNAKWHFYHPLKPSAVFDELIREVDRDPTGIFWG